MNKYTDLFCSSLFCITVAIHHAPKNYMTFPVITTYDTSSFKPHLQKTG